MVMIQINANAPLMYIFPSAVLSQISVSVEKQRAAKASKCTFCSHKFQGLIDENAKKGLITDAARQDWLDWQIKL